MICSEVGVNVNAGQSREGRRLTSAFLIATASLLVSRVFLPGILMGVRSIGNCCRLVLLP